MRGIQTTRFVCVGRILETGIWVLQNEYIGHVSDSKSAQQGQAACPCWVTCLPHLGKRRAQIEPILYVITHPAFQTEESARSTPFQAVSVLRFLSYIYMLTDIVIECCRCVPSLRQGHKSSHQQTIQTIGWQLDDSQLSVCQNITAKNQMVWQFLSNSCFYRESSDIYNFYS